MAIFKYLFSGEMFFLLFLVAGSFKSALSFLPFDITLLFFLLSIFVAMKRLVLKKSVNVSQLKYIILFLIFAGFILLSTIYSSNEVYGLDKGIRFFVLTSWAYIGAILILNDEKSLKRFYLLFAIFALFLSVSALNIYIENQNIGNFGFITVYGSDYLYLGRITAIGCLISLFYLFKSTKETKLLKKLLIISSVGVTLFALSISGARMPLISLILVVPLFLMIFVKYKNGAFIFSKRVKSFVSILVLAVISAIFLLRSGYFNTIAYRLTSLFQNSSDKSVVGRFDRFEKAIEIWSDNILFGAGIGGFDSTNFVRGDYPHNIFLEVLSELGLVGLTFFVVILLVPIVNFFIKKGESNFKVLNIMIFLFLFLNANITGDINDNKLLFCFIAISSISHFYGAKKEKNKSSQLDYIAS